MKHIPWDRVPMLPIGTKITIKEVKPYSRGNLSYAFLDVLSGRVATIINFSHDNTIMQIQLEDHSSTHMACGPHSGSRSAFFNSFEIYTVEAVDIPTSNKGLSKCFQCSCPTEMMRDFETFSVREMCPRCKV